MTTLELENRIKMAKAKNKILYFAHRGVSGLARDNSRKAFQLIHTLPNIDGVEFDVQQTKDGKLIICHNLSLQTPKGQKWIYQLTLKEIRQILDSESCPTFEDAIKIVKRGNKIIDIELKSPNIAKRVIKQCKHYGIYERVIFSTVYEGIFDEIRSLDQDIAIMYGYPRDKGKDLAQQKWTQFFVRMYVKIITLFMPVKIRGIMTKQTTKFYSLYHKVITKGLVSQIHNQGNLCIGVVICLQGDITGRSSVRIANHLIKLGVDMIKMDYPHLMTD